MWVQEAVLSKRVNLVKADGTTSPADLMTKALSKEALEDMLHRMSVMKIGGRAASAPMLVKNHAGKWKRLLLRRMVVICTAW